MTLHWISVVILLATLSIVNAFPFHVYKKDEQFYRLYKRATTFTPCTIGSPVPLNVTTEVDPTIGGYFIATIMFTTDKDYTNMFLTTKFSEDDTGKAVDGGVGTGDLCADGFTCPVAKGSPCAITFNTTVPDAAKVPYDIEFNVSDGTVTIGCSSAKIVTDGAGGGATTLAPSTVVVVSSVVITSIPTVDVPENSTSTTNSTDNSLSKSIIGAIVGSLITICLVGLGFLLFKVYKNKKERSKAIATPGSIIIEERNEPGITNNGIVSYEDKLLPPNPKEKVISNPGQEFTIDSDNQKETAQNNSIGSDVIQNLRQELIKDIRKEMAEKSIGQDSLNNNTNMSLTNIDKDIIDQMKQEVLQDIKQELKQNLRKEVFSSLGGSTSSVSNS